MVGHIPPLLSVSFSLSQKRMKHTRENIVATKEFTVNIISEAFAEAANCTAAEAPADGLSPRPAIDAFLRDLGPVAPLADRAAGLAGD